MGVLSLILHLGTVQTVHDGGWTIAEWGINSPGMTENGDGR